MSAKPHVLALVSTLLASVVLAPDAPGQRRGGRDSGPPPKLANLTYAEKSFESAALGGREATYGVFLPADYDAEENQDQRYPLVIWLHGMWEDHNRFLRRGGGEVLDEMTGEGSFPKAVFVCADGDRSSFWTNAVQKDSNYEDLVTQDLLAHLEKTYRIREDRGGRAIAGVSMGGYGALKIALKDPSLFGVVAAHSAAVLPPDLEQLFEEFPWLQGRRAQLVSTVFGDPVDEERYRAENVLALAAEVEPEKLAGLRIYFDCGDEDNYGFFRTNQQLHELLEKREIPHTWRPVEGGGHSWGAGFTQAALTHSLRFIAQQFAAKQATKGLEGLLGPGKRD